MVAPHLRAVLAERSDKSRHSRAGMLRRLTPQGFAGGRRAEAAGGYLGV